MAQTIYLHAGLHKTGTTSLQKLYRSRHAKLARNDVFIPKPRLFETGRGGLNIIPKELNPNKMGKVSTSITLEKLLGEFRHSKFSKFFLSSEGFSRLEVQHLQKLKKTLAAFKVIPIMTFRHPILHATSSYCSLGAGMRSRPPYEFLTWHATKYNYGDLAKMWTTIFSEQGVFFRYENYKNMLAPFRQLLSLPEIVDKADKKKFRRSLDIPVALANMKLSQLCSVMGAECYFEKIYNNIMHLQEHESYLELRKQFAPNLTLFTEEEQSRYLASSAEQLELLKTYVEPSALNSEPYDQPIRGSVPTDDEINAVVALFLELYLPKAHFKL